MPASSEILIQLPAGMGLHARPAGVLVRLASGFQSAIQLAVGDRQADAKSILDVLALGADGGTVVRVRADGPDAEDAVIALAGCLRSIESDDAPAR
jgi:phosphotransferase system HPr (HPr) family protein